MQVDPVFSRHPLSAAYPSMPGHEIDALAADIKHHGLRHGGVLYEGMILDGWHRYRACEISGVPFRWSIFDGDSDAARALVRSANHHRRQMTDSQRAQAAEAVEAWQPGGRVEPGSTLKTNAQMAAEAEVTTRTIRHAKVAQTAGLGPAVTEGVLSGKRAAEIAKTEPKAAKEIASAVAAGDIGAAKRVADLTPRPIAANDSRDADMGPDLAELVDELQAENKRLSDIVSADDKAVEALKWRAAYDRSLTSQSEAMDCAARSEKREKFTKAQLMRCGKAVGEDDPRKIAAAVEAAVSRKTA